MEGDKCIGFGGEREGQGPLDHLEGPDVNGKIIIVGFLRILL
jgi:hypothetical protein